MARSQHGALHDEHVRAGLLRDVGTLLGPRRHAGDRARHARVLYLLDAFADELRLDRLAVRLFQHRVEGGLVGGGDPLDDRARVLVTRVHAVEVEDCDAAELAHRDRELDIDHSVHGRSPERELELETIAHREGDVDLVGVERDAARHECDLVESIGATRVPPDADLKARLLPGKNLSGCDRALLQGVFTPMRRGCHELYGMPSPHILVLPCIARSSTCAESPTTT